MTPFYMYICVAYAILHIHLCDYMYVNATRPNETAFVNCACAWVGAYVNILCNIFTCSCRYFNTLLYSAHCKRHRQLCLLQHINTFFLLLDKINMTPPRLQGQGLLTQCYQYVDIQKYEYLCLFPKTYIKLHI
jgi:hypothetical protein